MANLVTAAQRQGRVQRVVLVSSIGADDPFFPLNALWGVRTPLILDHTRAGAAVHRTARPAAARYRAAWPSAGTAACAVMCVPSGAHAERPARAAGAVLEEAR